MSYKHFQQQQQNCCPSVLALPPFPSTPSNVTSGATLLTFEGFASTFVNFAFTPGSTVQITSNFLVPFLDTTNTTRPENLTGVFLQRALAGAEIVPLTGKAGVAGFRYNFSAGSGSIIGENLVLRYTVFRSPVLDKTGLAPGPTQRFIRTNITGDVALPPFPVATGTTIEFSDSVTVFKTTAVQQNDQLAVFVELINTIGGTTGIFFSLATFTLVASFFLQTKPSTFIIKIIQKNN